MIRRIAPDDQEDLDNVRELFLEYAGSLGQFGNAICFPTFMQEVAELPGAYAPPGGDFLMAFTAGPVATLAGCAAFRSLAPKIAEMKRLYIRPAYRSTGLGKDLTLAIAAAAQRAGHKVLRLDTLPQMAGAIGLYRALGFQPIPAYGGNPPEALCFELRLSKTIR